MKAQRFQHMAIDGLPLRLMGRCHRGLPPLSIRQEKGVRVDHHLEGGFDGADLEAAHIARHPLNVEVHRA